MEKKKWDLISVASIPLIMTLGNSMLIPVLPMLARELGITTFQVSLIITVYAVVAIVLIPLAGFLSDRYGRKRVIIPSLILAGLGGALSASAYWLNPSWAYAIILAGRFLQGIGAAGAFPIVLPLVGDMFRNESDVSKGLGVVETSNTFGKVLSPVLGSALALIAWYAPFASIPVFCTVSLLLVAFLVKAPQSGEEEEKPRLSSFLHSIGSVLKQKGRWLSAIFMVGGISMFIIFGVLFYLSNVLEEVYAIDGIRKGGVLAIPLGALCTASFITGKTIGENKKRMKWVSTFGMLLLTGGVFAIGLYEGIWLLVGLLVLAGIGIGVALPCLDAMITEGIGKKQRGTVTSLYSSMRFIGVSLGPPAVSLLTAYGHRIVFFTLSGVCAAGFLVTLLLIRPKQGQGASGGGDEGGERPAPIPWRIPAR
ncbi:MFS transporter [Gorillibacterium sp. sgz5001074]|uniref:MFS transporter n=1 Tax=Gorillibacterium sp. sgz5001074 TaxID=3446695 RepID=UPI003F67EDAC